MNLILARPLTRTYNRNKQTHQSSKNRIRTNILESDENFYVQLALSGYQKEELLVNIEENKLVVEAKVKKNQELNPKFNLHEFDVHDFKKIYSLGEIIDQSSVEAKYNDGLLEIKLNKKQDLQKTITVS